MQYAYPIDTLNCVNRSQLQDDKKWFHDVLGHNLNPVTSASNEEPDVKPTVMIVCSLMVKGPGFRVQRSPKVLKVLVGINLAHRQPNG